MALADKDKGYDQRQDRMWWTLKKEKIRVQVILN